MGWTHVHQTFEFELVELLGVLRVKGTEDIFLDTFLKRKTFRLNHHHRCVCGRATLLLPFCLACSKIELSEAQVEEDLDEVDIPDEPMQAAVYQQTGVLMHLKRRKLEELFRQVEGRARKQFWERDGELRWYALLVRPGVIQGPAIPPAASFRMMAWLGLAEWDLSNAAWIQPMRQSRVWMSRPCVLREWSWSSVVLCGY